MNPQLRAVVVTGPTASGKTCLAVELARAFNGEIVSADSRQVYRGMDIGTGKDLGEYGTIPYHVIDVVDPQDVYHLSAFLNDASAALRAIDAKQRLPIIAGGTPLWIDALLKRYEMPGSEPDYEARKILYTMSLETLAERLKRDFPAIAARFHDWENINRLARAIEIGEAEQNNLATAPDLPELDPLIIAPYYPRDVIRKRVKVRLDQRLTEGMLDEARRLLEAGVTHERLEFLGLEYRYMARHLSGQLSFEEMRTQLYQKICQFVKRQDIWFRKLEREGAVIHWIPNGDTNEARALTHRFLAGEPLPPPAMRLNDIRYG